MDMIIGFVLLFADCFFNPFLEMPSIAQGLEGQQY